MAITPWDDIKAQVGYEELPTEGKVDTINKYSQYVQEYYTQVEPRDEKEVGQASDEFVKIASQDALGDLGAVERGSAFLGNIYKGASGTFTSAFKAAALAQQAIGESLGSYDDNTPVTERDIYKIAQSIDESVRQTTGIEDPRLRNDFINTLLPQGLGSALGFLGVAAAAAAAAPEAAVGAVGLGTAAALGAATNAGSTYEEAKQAGANEFTSRASAIAGGVVGLTEAIPLGGLAGRLTAGIAKRSILRGVVEGASEEFLQETGSQMANNFIASKFAGYDPNRGIMDGALQSGAVGLVTGGLIGGGVNAITRDNEAFYADKLSDELKSKADLAASLTPERLTQITEAARNANTTTRQRIDIETGETETTSTPKTVFGDRLAGEVPDIGNNPAINSVPLGRSISQDADGNNTETFTFHTPQGLLWEAEFKTGEPVKVRDVTDDSPLLNPITSPADPRTATRSQFTGRIISPTSSIAKEFGLETEQEMDRRLIAEAQREMQLGRVTDQTLLPDNQIIPESVSRDDRGVARQVVLNNEIERLYKIREGVLARQILVGQNPNAGTTEYDPNTAREVIRYDSEGNRIENKQETSQRVARLNRMIGMRETELRGLTARPEGYILASERNTPPSASQKLSLVQGFQNLWNSISSPALRNAITFEVGDITPLIESGQVPKGAVAYYKRASDGRKAMIFLSDKLATMPMARREMIHELGHAFWDTLPAGVQAEIRGLWKAETESRTGALFDEFGGLRAEVSPRVMDSVQEFFSERLAWTNDQWAKGISEKNSVMDKAGRAFRNLLDRFLRYTGHGERLNLEFRSFLDQGDRFKGLRTRVEQALEAGRAAINEEPQPSIRGLAKYEQLFDYTRNNPDGFTVDPILFNVPTTGYIVAPSKNTEGEMPLNMSREEGIKAFRSYLLSNDDIFRAYGIGQRLANVEGAGAYFGGWLKTTENNEALPKDQYKFVYDISFVLDNKTDALYVAENGKQDAIFDISAGQTIDTAPAVRDLRASGLYTPSDRGRLQELGGKVDYLAGRKGSLRTAVESIRRAVNPAVQAGRIQSQGRSLQEAGSPEVVASTRGAVSVESVPLRRDGVRLEKPSVKEVANFLQQRSIDRIQKPLTKDTPADVRMAQYLINTWSEVSYQLQQEDTGMTWYSQDIEQMESDLAQLYPESIDSIEEKMVLFKAMLVGNSFSQTPKAETLTTMRIWDSSNQQFPVKPRQDDGKGWTVRGGTVEIYLNRINRLVAEKGEKGAADWLLSKHPIKELREYNPNVGGKQDDLKYGSMIFGQKGGAYHLNMNGNYDVLTADLHFSRMWNRMMGTVLDANGEIIQAPTPAELKIQDQAVRFAADKLGLSVAELQAVSWVYEIGLWKDLGAKIGYYKHSDGTAKLLKERGIQRREVVPDSRAIEERRQTALSRANALSDGRDTQQVLPEEVRASTRGQTRSILNRDDQILYHYTNIGRNFSQSELEGKTAREALLYIISKEGENRSKPNRLSFLSGSSGVNVDFKKWNKQYDRTLSIAKMLSRSEFDNLDSDKMRSGRLGDRAYRSEIGYIGIGSNGINLGVLVHEIAHTITADQIRKYTMRPSTMDSGSYAKQIRAALASSETPEPIKRIIRLYQSTLSQLNLTDQYLDGIKYKRNKSEVGVSLMTARRVLGDDIDAIKIGLGLWSTDGRSSSSLGRKIIENHQKLFPKLEARKANYSDSGDVVLFFPKGADLSSLLPKILGIDGSELKTDDLNRITKLASESEGRWATSGGMLTTMLVGGGSSKASPISNNNPDKTTRAGGDYAFGNLNEFIAEAFSNGSFQEVLETLDGDQKSSLWRDLVEAIANLLGITDTTMMFSIMDATFEIAEMSNKRAANIVDVSDVQASTRGEQAQRLLEPVISFGRQQLRTGGALPYDIFRMTEQRGFNVNEKLLRAQNAVSDIEAAVKRSYAKSLDQLPEAEIARINEGLQNPLARAKLPTDVASAVGNARNLIDSLTQDLLRSGAISEDLQPILEANKGVYLHRSYEKWENPNYKNPFNTLPKQVQNKLVTTVTSYLHNKYANAYAKEQSLARGEVAINPDSGTYQADYQAGLAKARSGGVTKAEVDGQIEYLASPETDSPFGQIGSGLTKDLSIITARKNIPEEIRMLWGEIKDPRVNFLKSVQKMSGFLEAHNMLKGMRDAGMNKIFFTTPRTGFTTKLVSDGSRTASPLNMFIDGMKNDVYTSEEISTALRNTFGGRAKAQDFLGKMGELYLKANGFSKFAKTVLSVQTQVRNLLGNGSFLVANGYIFSPDGITALNKLKTLALPSAGTQLGLNKSKEFRDYNAKLTRLGILGQSVFANEMESYFKDANVNTAADFLDNHVTKGLKAIARGATSLYQLGDAIPKIVAFEVELSRLRRAYPTQPLSKLEPMAADKVLNLLPTYSRIPRLGNVLRSQPFVGAFISFPLEVVRTGYNLLGTISDELRSDNPAIRQAGAYRLAGTMMASIGFSAVAAGIAAAMGIDDDEDKAIRKLDAPWDKYSTKLYLGRDEKGNVNQVNMSYVDPYNYFRDPIIALIKRDGTWDQKLLESVKTAFQPLYGEQILSSKVLDITRNTKGTTGGRVYNPEADLASKASAISAHMFDAFNIGTFTSSIRIYKGLTGQVTQTGRAYDPALETIATLTGQRVVSLDPRQSLGFAARKFSNRLNDATGIFTAAYYDRSNVSNEARMEAYKQMSRSRKEIFNDTAGTISAAMKLGVSRGEVMRILKEQGVSMDNSRALLSGLVAVYKPAKREMKGDAIRFRQQVYAGQ